MTHHVIKLDVDLNKLAAIANVAIWRSFQLVSLSLHASRVLVQAIADGGASSELPGLKEASIQITPHAAVDDAAVSTHEQWVVTNGLRDAIEAVSTFLEEVRVVSATYRLARRGSVPAPEFTAIEAFRPKFHEYGLPPKLRYLRDEFQLWPDDGSFQAVISINDARNCLVHRGGRVASKDVNSPEGLRVSWRRLRLHIGRGEAERTVGPGDVLEAGETVSPRLGDNSKDFRLGERVVFSPQEFAEICLTLRLFVDTTVKAVERVIAPLTETADPSTNDSSEA